MTLRYLLHRAVVRCNDNGMPELCRPWCWARGYHVPHHCDAYFEVCTTCGLTLWSRSRDGFPNPYYDDDGPLPRVNTTWRRL